LSNNEFIKAKRNDAVDGCYVVMFDLDHFKKVNDTYGHPAGDAVLKAVANRVVDTIRPYDLFGRYGGEEFILFLTDITEEHLPILLERLRTAICESPINVGDGVEVHASASFGAVLAIGYETLDEAIKAADVAAYEAKRGGRNRFVIGG
jgi:diguanylate cyclase (GGDEF)-like protein